MRLSVVGVAGNALLNVSLAYEVRKSSVVAREVTGWYFAECEVGEADTGVSQIVLREGCQVDLQLSG